MIDEAYRIIKKICGDNYTEKIFELNQYNIIMNK